MTGDGNHDVEGYILTPDSAHLIGRSATSLTKAVILPVTIKAYLGLIRDALCNSRSRPIRRRLKVADKVKYTTGDMLECIAEADTILSIQTFLIYFF